MEALDIFVSVGDTATQDQEDFVCAVEERLRTEGLVPHTVGRNTFTSDAPLEAVTALMQKCSGAVVIALERSFFPSGVDKPGGAKQSALIEIRLATPWNQVEAGMAYVSKLPLLVIMQKGVKNEGVLTIGNRWYVQQVTLSRASLATSEFNGVLNDWKDKVNKRAQAVIATTSVSSVNVDPAQMRIDQLLRSLKPAQLWAFLTALAASLAGAFSLGAYFLPKK